MYDIRVFWIPSMDTGYDTASFRLLCHLTEYETTAYKLRSMLLLYRVRYISIGVRYNSILVTIWGYRVRHDSVTVTIQHNRARHSGTPGTLRQYTGKFDTILHLMLRYNNIFVQYSPPYSRILSRPLNLWEQIKYCTEYIKFKKAYSLSQRPQV